ncbi:MAG: MXAN_6521/LA_1396 family lipoprotein [Deltaproteobacteria bacterium]|nr:MXAN_6521/LA_1396 family lipoprotein [Deltaproteobacteria bacterium]
MPTRSLALIALALLAGGCGTVRSSWIRPDYPATDRTETVRLQVITSPAPADVPEACELMSLVARRYTNQKRDFIAKVNRCDQTPPTTCDEGIDGLLLLEPTAEVQETKIALKVEAKLLRCKDREPIWTATGAGRWPKSDDKVKELAATYGSELGAVVIPWVPATFHLLRAMLDTLPMPALMGEEAVMEKIELGE